MPHEEFVTRPSLLLRVRDHRDDDSWSEFVEIYGPLIHRYALSRGVHRDTVPDVVQDVLKRVMQAIKKFEYDPDKGHFRSWLYTIIRRHIFNVAKKGERKLGAPNRDDPADMLGSLPNEQDQQDWDRDYQTRLVHWAMSKIRHEFNLSTWEAFQGMAIKGESAQEVAARLGVSVGSVYVSKSRVFKRLLDKVQSVDEAEWEWDAIRKESEEPC